MSNTLLPLKNFLLSLDLSEKEVNVYLVLLSLGKGTVSEIARRAEINRTTGYDILDKLVAYRLISISGKEPKQEYVAESPDRVVEFLEKKKRETEERLEAAKTMVPQLKSVHNVSDRPQVRFYEGVDGLRQVYEDTLSSHEPIRAYASVEDVHSVLTDYFPHYYKRRAKKGIPIRAIFTDTPGARERARHNKDEARESAFVPAKQFEFHPEINIYDNKIMIASWREKLGIIIESSEIADAMKKIFELSWAEAKRLDKKQRPKSD